MFLFQHPTVVQKYDTYLSDSFVAKNKLRTLENAQKDKPSSGEARLYLGGITTDANKLFIFDSVINYRRKEYQLCSSKCFFKKSNLIEYMKNVMKTEK